MSEFDGAEAPLVGLPFDLDIEHPPLHLSDLFLVTRIFDLSEEDAPFRGKHELARRLRVRVLQVCPNQTRLRITPQEPMRLAEVQDAVTRLVQEAGAVVYGGRFQVMRLEWDTVPAVTARTARILAPQP